MNPSESSPPPDGYDFHVVAPAEHVGLTCRFLKPPDFNIADLAQSEPDFAASAQFLPLAVAVSPYGPMVFSLAARPGFDDGTVSQWLEFICDQEGYPHSSVTETLIGQLPAVTCDATQQADDGTSMKMRFVLLEDGGRLFQMSAMAPEAFWSAALKKMEPMLASLELRQVAGSNVPLFPGRPAPVPASPPESTVPSVVEAQPPEVTSETPAPADLPTAVMTPAEFLAMALAEDTASLDPELPLNANLRDRGVGLVPRIHEADPSTRAVVLGVGALAGFLRVPFGWQVIDDGRRTLVFDAGGRIQVSLSQRGSDGATPSAHARQLLEPYLERQPDLPKIEAALDQICAAGLRGVDVDGVCLDQYFLIRDLGRPDSHLVARVTATAEDAKRALDLAGDLLATFRPAETFSMSRT